MHLTFGFLNDSPNAVRLSIACMANFKPENDRTNGKQHKVVKCSVHVVICIHPAIAHIMLVNAFHFFFNSISFLLVTHSTPAYIECVLNFNWLNLAIVATEFYYPHSNMYAYKVLLQQPSIPDALTSSHFHCLTNWKWKVFCCYFM